MRKVDEDLENFYLSLGEQNERKINNSFPTHSFLLMDDDLFSYGRDSGVKCLIIC